MKKTETLLYQLDKRELVLLCYDDYADIYDTLQPSSTSQEICRKLLQWTDTRELYRLLKQRYPHLQPMAQTESPTAGQSRPWFGSKVTFRQAMGVVALIFLLLSLLTPFSEMFFNFISRLLYGG